MNLTANIPIRLAWLATLAVAAMLTSAGRSGAASPRPAWTPRPDARVEADCRKYFKHAVCSEALGRWLPALDRREADPPVRLPTRVLESFVHVTGTTKGPFNARTPAGTFFVFGDAGPPRGRVAYDPRHRIAFYADGCCSYFHTVLASGVAPPPRAVAARDLRGVTTDLGIRLGDSPAAVKRVYGSAELQREPAHLESAFLAYENGLPRPPPGPCVQRDTFVFRNGRLVMLDIDNGC